MVEVFKTNVEMREEAISLIQLLKEHLPENRINFDLSDCDRVLRVEGEHIIPDTIISFLKNKNYQCEILE